MDGFVKNFLSVMKIISIFFPEINRDIDWNKAPLFMDKELSQIIKDAKTVVGLLINW